MHGEASIAESYSPGFGPQVCTLAPSSLSAQQGEAGTIETSVACLPGLASVEAYSYKTNEWFFSSTDEYMHAGLGRGVVR